MRLAQVLKLPSMARVTLVHIAQPESEVRGVHIVDFPNPAPWVRAGQVLLTTGYAWPRDDHLQRAMVHQLADCRLTALGLAVPGFFERMPQAVLDVAIERGLTLFEIPWIDSFARIVEEIHGAIIAEQYRVIQRSEEIHRSLTHAAVEAATLEDLMRVVARQLGHAVSYDDITGHVVARAPTLGSGHVPEAVQDTAYQHWLIEHGYLQRMQRSIRPIVIPPACGHGRRLACPVHIKRDWVGVLWIEYADDASPSELDRRAAEHAAIVIALHEAHQRARLVIENSVRHGLLAALLLGQYETPHQIHERALTLGVDLDRPHQLAIVAMRVPLPLSQAHFVRREHLGERISRIVQAHGGAAVITLLHDQIPFLVADPALAQRVWHEIAADDLLLALGQPCRGVEAIRHMFDALGQIMPRLAAGVCYGAEDLLIPRLLLGDRAAGQAFVELMLAPLRANRQSAVLLDTLLCWITHGFNARTAAETLNVHYKTVVYRLDRITELTGWHLADPALRFQLQLIDRILSLNDKITR